MSNNKFVRNFSSNTATKVLDLSESLPLAPSEFLLTEEIPAAPWKGRGFDLALETEDCQVKISILVSFDKRTPRTYKPVYTSILNDFIEFTVASDSDPGYLTFSDEFKGDFIQFKIENTGTNPIEELTLKALLSDPPEFS